LGYFSTINIAILLIDLAMAWHVIRSGRSPLWIMGMGLVSFFNVLALVVLWLAYLVMAVIPDFLNSHGMRRFRGSVAEAADPGRGYREKKRQAELVGSVDSKRALAEESVKRGLYAVNFSGGSVDITNGKFVFAASEAYLIEDGRVTAPVKGAMLIGNGAEALQYVSMVGHDLALDEGIGTCGKRGQGVPVCVGTPTMKLDKMTVGGTGR